MPASRALPIDWAPDDVVERVVALKSVAFQAGIIVGPALFGFIFVAGPSFPYLAAVISYCVANLLLLTVGPSSIRRLGTTGGRQAFRDAKEGLKFIRKSPVLFGAISLDLGCRAFGWSCSFAPCDSRESFRCWCSWPRLAQSRCRYRSNAGSCDLIDQTFEKTYW